MLELLSRERNENCRKMQTEFIQAVKAGTYDKLNLTVKEPVIAVFIQTDVGTVEKTEEEEEGTANLGPLGHQVVDVQVSQQLDLRSEPIFGFDQDMNTLFIKPIPRGISRF